MKARTKQLLLLCMMITAAGFAKTKIGIEKALQGKMIKAEVICKGGLKVNYAIRNQVNDSLQIVIPAGWRMNSVKEEYQDILVTHEQIITLRKNEQKSVEVKGYCCEASHSGPVNGAKYESGKLADSNLVKLARFLNAHPADENTEQYAVWAISDKKPTSNICSANDSLATLLRHFVAGIKGEPIPWYTLRKLVRINSYGDVNEYPIQLKASVNYSVDKTCYAWFFVLDSLGHKVGVIDGQWLTPGNKDYSVNVNVKDFKKGKYKIVLAGENKEFINREFEI